ncbi:DUF5763 domain-containing protein [Ichthyenterobacterium magnum]|uniref:Uncharacterized protein n=1 Tax=Ichthyenterobacterium magnum TaxID=1230530 RepID=A0A420DFC3_9FLAO|nr:DUF5763 domain-containing protein [Ichthyenterobacterium magnum]RKE91920.1 hypothetical protein BXY80_2349 [Ichthyenterobacterium magnum]
MSPNHKLSYCLALFFLLVVSSKVNAQSFYKTPSGEKYHLSSCRMVENVSKKLSDNDISKYGLTPCKICKPPIVKSITNSFSKANKAVGISNTVQCKGKTKKGIRCKHKTSLANGYCYQHTKQNSSSNSYSSTTKTTASTCGARTKSGGYCKRKVKNGDHCYQH